jgi:hypothetical protein
LVRTLYRHPLWLNSELSAAAPAAGANVARAEILSVARSLATPVGLEPVVAGSLLAPAIPYPNGLGRMKKAGIGEVMKIRRERRTRSHKNWTLVRTRSGSRLRDG